MHRASQFRPWSCGIRKTTARSARRLARRRCSRSSRYTAKRAARSSMVILWPPIRAGPFPSTAMPALKKRWSRRLPSSSVAKKRIDGTSDYRDGRCNRCLVEIRGHQAGSCSLAESSFNVVGLRPWRFECRLLRSRQFG